MLQSLIQYYRQKRKAALLRGTIENQFAFVGVGMHSMDNLYPALQHQGVPLRWIQSRTLANANAMAARFPNARATDDVNELLRDEAVKGVFICAHSSVQRSLALQALAAGKQVWVEKPVAAGKKEWEELATAASGKIAIAGHQRRFAPCYQIMKSRVKAVANYRLSYTVGPYPEGDVLSEIFIHPLDLMVHLFGPVQQVQAEFSGAGGECVFQLLAKHENGSTGTLYLSSRGNWNDAGEELIVEANRGVFIAENFRKLLFIPKGRTLLGVPMEKVKATPAQQEVLYSASGFLPQASHNEVMAAGFYGSLQHFVRRVSGVNIPPVADVPSLGPVFTLMDALRAKMK